MTTEPTTSPRDLRVEHRDGIGIGERDAPAVLAAPRRAARQLAYELRLDDGTTERVDGDASVLVPWPGRPLASGERRDVRVRVETDRGTSAWSEPVAVEAGLLDASDGRPTGSPADRDSGAARATGRRTGCVARSSSTARSAGRRSTRPRTGSTSSSWTPPASATDELTPGFTEYATAPRCRPTTSPACSRRARTCSARCSPTAGTAARSGSSAPPTSGASGRRSSPSCTSSTTTAAPPSSAPTPPGAGPTSHILAADLIEGQREDRRLLEAAARRGSTPPVAAGRRQRARVRALVELAGTTGAPRWRSSARSRSPSCVPACTSSTSARTSTAGFG